MGMSIDKAIEIIKADSLTSYSVNEILKARDLAIKALEQEPCEDAVSRQEVLDLIADYDLSMGQVVRGIHALPSVTPQEPKTGHWIDDKCSVCGKGIEDLIDSREWYRNEEPKFCPFCGIPLEWESEE